MHDRRPVAVEFVQFIEQPRQRDVDRPRYCAAFELTPISHVDDDEVGDCGAARRKLAGGQPRAALNEFGVVEERLQRLGQVAADIVEADPAQANLCLELAARFAHQHDVLVGPQHIARPLGEPAAETHIHRAAQMTGCEVGRFARVQHDRAVGLPVQHLGHR